ncbi:hypothetical protein [Homoserinibacter sp. GY 40078]|uniref:hypothetical protein n=1 Tax=Homoserinibacter sp. GY 40078 TaxID=2603275 RepID=UPI0011CCC7EE|nr:hypothetical protein [Homoserinibacter sp. GY 40078]TXK17141.1 hypothetical protein FVQ89_09745 [Homoserinibacter sp. GY 40078]
MSSLLSAVIVALAAAAVVGVALAVASLARTRRLDVRRGIASIALVAGAGVASITGVAVLQPSTGLGIAPASAVTTDDAGTEVDVQLETLPLD